MRRHRLFPLWMLLLPATATGSQINPRAAFDGTNYLVVWDSDLQAVLVGAYAMYNFTPR